MKAAGSVSWERKLAVARDEPVDPGRAKKGKQPKRDAYRVRDCLSPVLVKKAAFIIWYLAADERLM
jgi:hypothetical protein